MGKLALVAKITHVPSMYLSELDGPRKGTRQDAIDGHMEIDRRCRALGVDTIVVFDTHWLVNANYHINCAPYFKGTYTSNELPHFIANMPFEEVRYWKEMVEIMDWTQTNVHHTMFICWGAQAALHYFHKARRVRRQSKAFGVFRHRIVNPRSVYLRGFSDSPMIPVSRINDMDRDSLGPDIEILIDSDIGVCFLDDPKHRAVHMLNHLEYDNRSLADEYERDVKAGLDTPQPVNLFPNGDTSIEPENRWRSHAHLLFQNWINEIYQTTPFEMDRIGSAS